jgi:hypothetical protein
MIDAMDRLLDQCMKTDFANTTKFKCMKILRDALLDEDFSTEAANLLACKIELKVSNHAWNEYETEITAQLKKFAKIVAKLYGGVEEEFLMDIDCFIENFGKDLSYTMEL